jgi:hypothetical protein
MVYAFHSEDRSVYLVASFVYALSDRAFYNTLRIPYLGLTGKGNDATALTLVQSNSDMFSFLSREVVAFGFVYSYSLCSSTLCSYQVQSSVA